MVYGMHPFRNRRTGPQTRSGARAVPDVSGPPSVPFPAGTRWGGAPVRGAPDAFPGRSACTGGVHDARDPDGRTRMPHEAPHLSYQAPYPVRPAARTAAGRRPAAARAGSRRSALRRAVLAGTSCLLLATVGLTLDLSHTALNGTAAAKERPSASGTAQGTTTADRASSTSSALSAPARTTALGALLERRAAAVAAGDRDAWLSAVDPGRTGFRRTQSRVFDRLLDLPVVSWDYRVLSPGEPLSAKRSAQLGGQAFLVRVQLRYRLESDTQDTERAQFLTVVRRTGHWYLVSDSEGDTERDLWDLGPVTVATGDRSLIVSAGDGPAAEELAEEIDAAADRVDRVWGEAWARTVVLLVPRDREQMADLLDRPDSDSLDQVAAVTTGPMWRDPDGDLPPRTADRIVLNPEVFDDLNEIGRRVVLTHETTHVATRATMPAAPPLWLEEGFADYVAYLGAGLSDRSVVRDAREPDRGQAPTGLPGREDFDPDHGPIASAYAEAWAACDLIARTVGRTGLVHFYRTASDPTAARNGAEPVAVAFREVMGTSQERFENRWREYLDDLVR